MGPTIRARGQLAVVLALGAAVRGWLLARPIEALDGRSLPDDAYIAMEIARNIGWGQGPRFVDYLTNGFQPLFVWLAAIPFWWTTPGALDPSQLDFLLKLALAISCTFDLGSLLLLSSAVHRGTGSRAAGLFAALLWALHPAVLRVAVNGLETSTAIFFLLCVWNLALRRPFENSTPAYSFGVGIVVGVAAMARIDLLFVGLFYAIASVRALRVSRRSAQGYTRWIARNIALAAGTLAGYAPWMIYSWHHTGAIIPGSGRAVRWITLTHVDHVLDPPFFVGMLSEGLSAVDANLPIVGKTAALLAAAMLAHVLWQEFQRTPSQKPPAQTLSSSNWLLLPTVFCTSLFGAYTLYVFADWFFPRYLAPFHVLAISIVAAGVGALAERAHRHARRVWIVAVIAAVLATTAQPNFRRLLFEPPDDQAGYRNIGIWARHMISPGTVIGATQTGALAYYADGYRVVNLDGVVNPRAYRKNVAGDAMEYIRDEEIDYVVGWRRNYEYLKRNSQDFRDQDLPPIGYIEEFRSWGIQWEVRRVEYPDGRVPPPLGARR